MAVIRGNAPKGCSGPAMEPFLLMVYGGSFRLQMAVFGMFFKRLWNG
jgi:hypothetical protein